LQVSSKHESQREIFQKSDVYKVEETKAERTVKSQGDGAAEERRFEDEWRTREGEDCKEIRKALLRRTFFAASYRSGDGRKSCRRRERRIKKGRSEIVGIGMVGEIFSVKRITASYARFKDAVIRDNRRHDFPLRRVFSSIMTFLLNCEIFF